MRPVKNSDVVVIAARTAVLLTRQPVADSETIQRIADDAVRIAVAAYAARKAADAGKELHADHVATLRAAAERYRARLELPLDPRGMAAGLTFPHGQRSGFRNIAFLA